MNKPAAINDRRPSPPNAVNNDKRPSPSPSPVDKTKPNVSHLGSKMSDSNMFKPGPHVPPVSNIVIFGLSFRISDLR